MSKVLATPLREPSPGRCPCPLENVPFSSLRECAPPFSSRSPGADGLELARLWAAHHEKSMAYATAGSVIIGTPFEIESVEQAKKLPKIGAKIIIKIDEFLRNGFIQAARAALLAYCGSPVRQLTEVTPPGDVVQTEEYQSLAALQTVHGVGYYRANELYNAGVRTLEDLLSACPGLGSRLKHTADLEENIPRSEVESIHEFVKIQLDKVKPGSHSILWGGYRRGKEFSNDVDILITWPHQEGEEKGVLKDLIKRLYKKGGSEAGTTRTIVANRPATVLDALDKALVIFRHPANGTKRQDKFRRVDLVVTNWKNWGCAVVGWTGSTQFERDLRIYCKNRDLRFDSGGLRNEITDEVVDTGENMSEKDVFRLLELEWIPPELRNADP